MYAAPVLVAVSLCLGILVGARLNNRSYGSHGARSAMAKMQEVLTLIQDAYVDEVSPDSLVDISLREILKNLDPHSSYIPASGRTAKDRELESSFYGIGIQFQMLNDTVYVVEVITGGAAEQVGLQAGDRIVTVDGEDVTGTEISTDDIFKRLRGEEGTQVTVGVKRLNSPKILDFEMTRVEIPVTPIDASYMLNDSTGYVKIGRFSDNTYVEFLKSISQLRYKGAESLVIDLRGNTGGYMSPAVLMANEFFDYPTLLVSTRGRNWNDNNFLGSDNSGSFGKERLVVLIDEYTASASEILAGAIQDNDRGLIVGRRSFGKGLVQHSYDLADSSQVLLTVQRYYTPSGRCIQKVYKPGHNDDYAMDLIERYDRGETFHRDSIKVDSTKVYSTLLTGRTVYGGGGIYPDVFVPADTTGISSYYINVANAGLFQKYAFEFCDLNRDDLSEAENVDQLLTLLPTDNTLLNSFVTYANNVGGVRARWYYIEPSRDLIVNQLKALIARDILGVSAYYEIVNRRDPVVREALKQLEKGAADVPISAED